MCKIVLIFLMCLARVASADEAYIEGETYYGQPIVCTSLEEAQAIADTYAYKGLEELSRTLVEKNLQHICIVGTSVTFTIVREVSVHHDKETAYVIEITSGKIYYLIDIRRSAPRVSRRRVSA